MKKKTKLLIGIGLLLIALAIGLCVFLLSGSDVTDYNTNATQRAQTSKLIGTKDILILKSIEKNSGGDSKAEFYIYRLPDGAKAEDYLHLQVSDIGADSPLEHIGSASCTFIGDDPTAVRNLTTIFTK